MAAMDADAAYLALKARDARFDGRLFVGVSSTGIYCRPVCRVRTPRREHCRFFDHAAQAEAAGFRPCLKCRPEIAPGLAAVDSPAALSAHAARALVDAVHAGQPLPLPALAARLGVTDRHLRRIFTAAHGVSPLDFVTTQRLLLAKRLLSETALPVTEVALASGFASLRRFNAAFAARYRMPPSRLRRAAGPAQALAPVPRRDGAPPAARPTSGAAPDPGRAAARVAGAAAVRSGRAAADDEAPPLLRLAYRPPLDGDALMRFLAARALPGVEQVEDGVLRRTLALAHGGSRAAGWIECRFVAARCELQLRAAPALAPASGALLQRVRHAFDLDADPALVDPVLARMPLPPQPGLRLPGAFDGFELAVRAVLGQQVTLAAARTLAGRLVERFGMPLATPFDDLHRLFPDPATIAGADPDAIGALGIVRQRVRALQSLAAAVADGRLELRPGAPLAPTLQALRGLPGIGEWTLQLIAMRALAWPDAFPASDLGVRKALAAALGAPAADRMPGCSGAQLRRGPSVDDDARGAAPGSARSPTMPRPDAQAAAQAAEAWRPWRAYAVVRLWHALAADDASRSPAAATPHDRAGRHAAQPD